MQERRKSEPIISTRISRYEDEEEREVSFVYAPHGSFIELLLMLNKQALERNMRLRKENDDLIALGKDVCADAPSVTAALKTLSVFKQPSESKEVIIKKDKKLRAGTNEVEVKSSRACSIL